MNNGYLERAKKKVQDPRTLIIMASRRAKQLALGARAMVKRGREEDYLDVALLEIAEGKLSICTPEEALAHPDIEEEDKLQNIIKQQNREQASKV